MLICSPYLKSCVHMHTWALRTQHTVDVARMATPDTVPQCRVTLGPCSFLRSVRGLSYSTQGWNETLEKCWAPVSGFFALFPGRQLQCEEPFRPWAAEFAVCVCVCVLSLIHISEPTRPWYSWLQVQACLFHIP